MVALVLVGILSAEDIDRLVEDEPRGEVSLKGFTDPERVWKVVPTRSA
jgi:hypothetical protein